MQEERLQTVVTATPKASAAAAKRARGKKGKRRQSDNAMEVEEEPTATTTTTIREWTESKWVLIKSVQAHSDSIASIALVPLAHSVEPEEMEQQQVQQKLVIVTGANDGTVKLTRL
jgi:hypothetical protein